ncbi:MAG: S16 family serine protease [Candidatus Micrarchaeota archaeon]
MRILLLLMALSSLAAASCSGSITRYVPAVVGDDGGLVNVTITLAEGPGDAYVSVEPRTGVTTQESIEQAAAYAQSISGEGPCDVLVSFGDNPGTGFVDGPSAGTALAVMTYALLEGKPLRNDTVITGTIDEAGQIGPVGGLYEKARGAARMGAAYFVTPVENFYEMLLLRDMEDDYGIKVLQARSAGDVIGFMTENLSIDQEGLAVEERKTPDVPPYDEPGLAAFRPVSERMIELEESLVSSMPEAENDTAAVREFFTSEVARQEGILEKGYVFSAANEAFLNYIDVSTISVILSGEPDLARKKGEAGICLTGIGRPALTDSNFEWVVGADQRQAWAMDRLERTNVSDRMLRDESFVRYNELMYAQAWCHVAKEVLSAAPGGGGAIDESAWKDIAGDYLAQARAAPGKSGELEERLGIAQDSYDKGRYGAAIYDSVYIVSNSARPDDEEDSSPLATERRDSLWGKVYQSHAAFLLAQNQTQAAYGTALFAKGLDEATARMREAMEPAAQSPQEEPAVQDSPWTALLLGAAAALSLFLLLILLLFMTRRKHGDKRTRFGKADRAEKEKG